MKRPVCAECGGAMIRRLNRHGDGFAWFCCCQIDPAPDPADDAGWQRYIRRILDTDPPSVARSRQLRQGACDKMRPTERRAQRDRARLSTDQERRTSQDSQAPRWRSTGSGCTPGPVPFSSPRAGRSRAAGGCQTLVPGSARCRPIDQADASPSNSSSRASTPRLFLAFLWLAILVASLLALAILTPGAV